MVRSSAFRCFWGTQGVEKGGPTQGSLHEKHLNIALSMVASLYFGVEKATWFKWLQNDFFPGALQLKVVPLERTFATWLPSACLPIHRGASTQKGPWGSKGAVFCMCSVKGVFVFLARSGVVRSHKTSGGIAKGQAETHRFAGVKTHGGERAFTLENRRSRQFHGTFAVISRYFCVHQGPLCLRQNCCVKTCWGGTGFVESKRGNSMNIPSTTTPLLGQGVQNNQIRGIVIGVLLGEIDGSLVDDYTTR